MTTDNHGAGLQMELVDIAVIGFTRSGPDSFPMAASGSSPGLSQDHAVNVSERKKCERRAKKSRNGLRICETRAHGV